MHMYMMIPSQSPPGLKVQVKGNYIELKPNADGVHRNDECNRRSRTFRISL